MHRLRKIAELSLTLSGDPVEIFRKISLMIGELLDVKIVCLSEIRGEILQFLSVYNDGDIAIDAGQCSLANTPCATVQSTKDFRFYKDVTHQFPEAVFLKEHNAVSYCGFPALDSKGNVIAVICLLDDKYRNFTDEDQHLLRILGQRIGFEIERKNRRAEKEKTESALAKREAEFKAIFNSISDAVVFTDTKRKIISINPSFAKTFGYQVEEVAGKTAEFIYSDPEEFKYQGKKRYGKGINIDESVYEIEYKRKDGTVFPSETLGVQVKDDSGNVLGFLGVIRDISHRKEMEETKEKLESHHRRVQKMEAIGTLAGGIAHDFNNILTAILGNINLALFDAELKDRTKKLLSEAEKASLRAKDLTQQLLTFAKGGDPVKEVSSLERIIKDSANFVLRGDKVACRYDIPEDLWLVDIDKGQISQVIQNLVLNASHAMPEGGIITVNCENLASASRDALPFAKGGRFVKISIQDSGIGMPANVGEKIFDPYFSTKHEGSGLGLAITQSIINKHNGHISVESSPGVGSTFTICLPASEKTKIQKQKSNGEDKAFSQAKILVMDDDEMVSTVAKEMLMQLGHEVVLAADGEEALKLYREFMKSDKLFDLVVMDLTIPGGMGGQEAVQKILNIDPDAKVIVSSGYSNDPIMANFKNYGFCSAIVKPYQLQEFSRVINQLLH